MVYEELYHYLKLNLKGGLFLLSQITLDASALETAFTTALSTIQSDVLGYLAIGLPVALAIFGSIFGIRKAIAFFKSAAGR